MSLRIVILASGRGSNARAIFQAIQAGKLNAEAVGLVCNIEDAPVLDLAKEFGVPAFVVSHRGLGREVHEAKVLETILPLKPDYLVLAGYMRMLTSDFLRHFWHQDHYRVVNIHPSLLPAFPGTHGYEDAYHYGVKISGVTVHFVDEAMDSGPIILQQSFGRLDDDSPDDFKQRGLAVEHEIYPMALQLLAQNRLRIRKNPESNRSYVEVVSRVLC